MGSEQEFIELADSYFRKQELQHSFVVARAAIHVYGGAHEALVKRYMLYLEAMAKQKSKDAKKDHPPRVLFVREVLASLPAELTAKLKEMANGEEAVSTGDKCVLIKERRVMVVGLLISEWRLLLDKQQTGPADRLQLISGVEEAVVRGLSQVEATPEMPAELKAGWNAWALKVRAGLAASSHTFSLSSPRPSLSKTHPRCVAVRCLRDCTAL